MRYATIGTSWITGSFIAGAKQIADMELAAVYSRTEKQGLSFALEHGCKRIFTDLEEMAACPDIDGVYIASPNFLHYAQSKLFLEHGKHVLCEKPLTVTYAQAEELTALARQNNLVYMEAIMMMHQPVRAAVHETLSQIGRIFSARLDYSQLSSKYPALCRGEIPHIFDPAYGAGCLMDLGVYCVYPALDFFGEPEEIHMQAGFLSTGADGWDNALFRYPDKQVAISCSKVGQSRIGSEILGDKGTITFDLVSQLTGIKWFQNDGSYTELAGDVPKADLMAGEAADFCRLASQLDVYAGAYRDELLYAQDLALKVSRTMERMRQLAGIHFNDK